MWTRVSFEQNEKRKRQDVKGKNKNQFVTHYLLFGFCTAHILQKHLTNAFVLI